MKVRPGADAAISRVRFGRTARDATEESGGIMRSPRSVVASRDVVYDVERGVVS